MTLFKRFVSMLALLALVSCGGGGGSSGTTPLNPNGGGSTSDVAGLVVLLSAASVVNNGTSTVTATVTAVDSSGVALPAGIPVTLAADNGGVITISGTGGSVTNSQGQVVATISSGSNTTPRPIKLTATSGIATGFATVNVIANPSSAVVSSINLVSSATSVPTVGAGATITAYVNDANNNAMAGVSISFSTLGATLSNISLVTNSAGVATATLTAGTDPTNRPVTVTVQSGGVTRTINLQFSGTKLTLSGPSSLILGNSTQYTVTAVDSNGNAIPNVAITATSSLGNAVVALNGNNTTNSAGVAVFNYTASTAGADTLVFSGAGTQVSPSPALTVSSLNFAFSSPAASSNVPVGTPTAVTVLLQNGGVGQNGLSVSFASSGGTLAATAVAGSSAAISATTAGGGYATVYLTSTSAGPVTVQASVTENGTTTTTTLPLVVVGTVPHSLVLQVSPTALAPNANGSTTNQAQVLATVTDANGNPVAGVTVDFTRVADPSGGSLSQVTALTNSSGIATVNYISGPQSSPANGVQLQGTVASAPSVSNTASLTVNQAALFIALGTGTTIAVNSINGNPVSYTKQWVAYVTDANGIAVNNVTLTVSAIPTAYLTGHLAWNGTVWAYAPAVAGPPSWSIYECRNEDQNGNGILDPGEDDNGDGKLEPGNVISVSPSSVQTVNGQAGIAVTYAESYAPWVSLKLMVTATVAGTESSTSAVFIVPGAAADFDVQTSPPAGVNSPFGDLPTTAALAKTYVDPTSGATLHACNAY